MLPFSKARKIAETWVAAITDGRAEIVRDSVQAKPYGWVFFYQTRDFLRDPDNSTVALAGNAPFIVDRINGEVRVLGTASPLAAYLSDYESRLPSAALLASPEPAKW